MEILVETVNLQKHYQIKSDIGIEKIIALEDVNIKILKGETFGVIGESGSGKTTLGKTIIRLVEPTGGKIFFDDKDISELKEKQLRKFRSRFQIIFQDPYKSLNPRLTIGNSISEGISNDLSKNDKIDRTKELLEIVGIDTKKYNNFPHQFSGGERQRISIARALSTNPEFIVCDEPTSNLDLSIQAKILNLFFELKEKLNLTYLFISHNLQIIKLISDKIAIMQKGRIVEEGDASKIISNPKHPYTKTLIEKI